MNSAMATIQNLEARETVTLATPLRPDKTLLQLAQEGDERAFEIIARSYQRMVRFRARSFFLRGAEYEDLIQEGMIGLFKAVRDYRPGFGSFQTFADLCITRQIITAVKAASRLKHEPLNAARSLDIPQYKEESGGRSLADSMHDPSALFEGPFLQTDELRQVMEIVRKCLSNFEYRVFTSWLEGRSYQEIADRLGKHEKAVDNGIWRVKCKIRRLLRSGTIAVSEPATVMVST